MNKHSALEFAIASLIPASRDRATARQAHSCAQLIEAFQRLFRDRGLPVAIRSANGLPFASPNGLYNLSRLSVCWLRLGISIERIKPGHPQQNGRHETLQTIDNPFGPRLSAADRPQTPSPSCAAASDEPSALRTPARTRLRDP